MSAAIPPGGNDRNDPNNISKYLPPPPPRSDYRARVDYAVKRDAIENIAKGRFSPFDVQVLFPPHNKS